MAGGGPDRDPPPQFYLTAAGTCRPWSRTAAWPALNHPMTQFVPIPAINRAVRDDVVPKALPRDDIRVRIAH